MPSNNTLFRRAAQEYFNSLRQIANSGSATAEESRKGDLHNLLNTVGDTLTPPVKCIAELGDQSAGRPDGGLFTARQLENPSVQEQKPERGVLEVKPISDDVWQTAESDQVSRYWTTYRKVLVTNFRDFVLLGEDENEQPRTLETFRLAQTPEEFNRKLGDPGAYANESGVALCEYLYRTMNHASPLVTPKDLAPLLAQYARIALSRVENSDATESLSALQQALEQSLDIHFDTDEGAAFFRSTLVQTLFYGMFSAWVLWTRQTLSPSGHFDWRNAVWQLRTPALRTMFQQMTDPITLQSLDLVEVLDWAGDALNLVNTGFVPKWRFGNTF